MKVDFAKCTFGQEEKDAVNRVLSGYWLASGRENEKFEEEFASYVGAKYAVAVNSGSSGLLLAIKSLNLPKGAKVLTGGCGFPATLAPVLHLGYEPVLVDYDINTHNIDINQVIGACENEKIDLILIAHMMGNPVDIKWIIEYADKKGIPVIEDCCESVGSMIGENHVGTFGKFGVYSFYPSHQITALGTGGMVVSDDIDLIFQIKSMRDWGRVWDWEEALKDHKTKYNYGELNYFKQYSFNTVGFNMKLSEAAAAFGREQLKRLDKIRALRGTHFNMLKAKIKPVEHNFIDIQTVEGARPSWFGFILTFKGSGFNRNEFSDYLEENGIRTRPFFAGNITRHKPYKHLEKDFPVADKLMRDSLFVGVHQAMTIEEIEYIASKVNIWVQSQLLEAGLVS